MINFKKKKIFITKKCFGCSICTIICPTKCIVGINKKQFIILHKNCTNCLKCIKYCTSNAISII